MRNAYGHSPPASLLRPRHRQHLCLGRAWIRAHLPGHKRGQFRSGGLRHAWALSMVVLCIDLDFSIGDRGYVLETGRLVAESPAETARFDIGLTLVFVHLLSEP